MRILALDLGPEWRGGQKQTALVLRGLALRGHAVRTLVRSHAPLERHLRVETGLGLEVVAVPEGAESSPRLLVPVARAARAFRPDVVYAGDSRGHGAAVWSLAASRVPLVVHRRVTFVPGRNPLSRVKYRSARRYLAISGAVARALEAGGVAPGRIAVVPDGLAPEAFVSAPPPSAPPYRLVHAGAFDGQKGQDLVVEILARLVSLGLDVRTLFLGEGPGRLDVAAAAGRAGVLDRCTFAGTVDDVPRRLAESHVLLLPTKSEGGGMVLLEAMAAGCATLAHDVGGTRETTVNGTAGLLLSSLAADLWVPAVTDLLRDELVRTALIASGRRAAEGRRIETTVSAVEAALLGVMA